METFFSRWTDSRRLNELAGLLLIVFALISLLSLLSYSGADETWFQLQPGNEPSDNWLGRVGATLSEALLQLLGVAVAPVPFLLAYIGWDLLRGGSGRITRGQLLGCLALGLALCALLDLIYGPIAYGGTVFGRPGGLAGATLAAGLRAMLNTVGAILVSITVVVAVALLITPFSFARAARLVREGAVHGGAALAGRWRQWRGAARPAGAGVAVGSPEPAERPTTAGPAAPQRRPSISVGAGESPARPQPAAAPLLRPARTSPAARAERDETSPHQTELPLERAERGYSLPPLDLLNEAESQDRESEQDLLERAKHITEKFREFSIDGVVVAIHPGPVVTTFEFKPEAGVKYSKVISMTDDLSLALKAESVRIDRMPGRSTVGIEVPNRHQETIYPRELIGSKRFRDCASKLTLALGKDIHGEVATAELDRMPHLLIAGATGAGKSVGLNGMIVSMLYKATPTDLRFIMIDTKMIELGIYADIPHLLIPVVTHPKHASKALQWAVREMEQRYRKLAAVGVRNIAQFNALVEEQPDRTMEDPKSAEPLPLTHLPYIVIVIDEMADLMMVSSADVEESVMRLAQMARAVGIHLILATQRPSVDVITGTIKANFPSRIAFRVSQRVDSRTIIDQQGAEHLLGRGDMLFLPTGSSRVKRLHSGFITEGEINRITLFLRKMAQPVFDESVLKEPDEAAGEFDDSDRDEMFVDAVRTVINEGKCSITLLQRRLQLGYARAARIVDMMEREGVVSPGEGSKPREVLVGPEVLESLEARL